MESLRGKVAIVTGASSGIGAGIAEYFAKQGSRLSLGGRNKDNLEATAKRTGLGPDDVICTVGDVMKTEDRENLIKQTVEKFGQIDILINNAGIGVMCQVSGVTEAVYDDIMNTNLKGPVFLTQLAIPHLIKSKGTVINISSVASYRPFSTFGAYAMSKAGLDMFTRVLALELGPQGVRVNSVNPGYVDTGMTETIDLSNDLIASIKRGTHIGRFGTPKDIAHVTAFLASDLAAFVTGETFVADGGLRYGLGDSITKGPM